MNKTLHKKLTEKYHEPTPALAHGSGEMFTALSDEMKLLRKAASELLQPRPQAVANLLKLAKTV
jgi:hypothetical protein